jgi:hypothetical protein
MKPATDEARKMPACGEFLVVWRTAVSDTDGQDGPLRMRLGEARC